jgi:endoglucanase
MDQLLESVLNASGISGSEKEITNIMKAELSKSCESVSVDVMGNVIARKGSGKKKIMLAAHMDEIGLMVKYISKEGFLNFIKIGGIDDRILVGQRVIVKAKKGDVKGIIGLKPPHLMKEEEKKQAVKYEELFIDIGATSREDALKRVSVSDAVIFEPNAGVLNGDLCYGKAVDNRVGCYILLKIMERFKGGAEVYGVATVQEEVGLKGARTSSFSICPDFALALDTTMAGDTPQIKESETSLKLGGGVAITIIEASGRGTIVPESVKDKLIEAAKKKKIKYQIDVIEGGMTDGAVIYMNREGILTGILSVPTRYIHSPTAVFSMKDVNAAIELGLAAIEKFSK